MLHGADIFSSIVLLGRAVLNPPSAYLFLVPRGSGCCAARFRSGPYGLHLLMERAYFHAPGCKFMYSRNVHVI